MNKPEMTAQVLVAVGAVFLLISAYVMGVYIPEQKELDDDFESQTSFDGDMTLFDATKSATLQGDFNPENALNSYLSADGANVQILAKADPALSDDDKTYYNFNASAFTSADVLTYVTTGTPGYFCFNNLISSAVIESASEHPALASGIRTFLLGLKIFAVSAIK